MSLETVIGLEIHVQLATRTKMFCGCAYVYGADPNTTVCPVCLGLPGALPVPNDGAVERALRAALALGCDVAERSVFARKNYFYPDLPKGYQITQYDRPLGTGGELAGVRLERVHLEEDTGKSLHDRFEGRTALDFNRAGVPLIEIVTEPDLRSPAAARAFLVRLKRLLEYLEVSDCDMEKGSLRVDANLSVRRARRETGGSGQGAPGTGPKRLGTKAEVKNLNSFSAVEQALAYEAERQARVLEDGGVVVQETRLWDAEAGETRPMRSKEESHDYRYFPEPDLPPLVVPPERVPAIRAAMPELPEDRERRFQDGYGLPAYDAGVLASARALADYFEATVGALEAAEVGDDVGAAGAGAVDAAGYAKAVANRIMSDVLAWLNDRGLRIEDYPVPPERLAELIELTADGTVSSSAGSVVLERMAEGGRAAAEIVEAEGLAQVSDDDALAGWVDDALAEHPGEAARLEAGEAKLVGFFMGKIMQASGGAADPRRAAELLRERAGDPRRP